MADFVHKYVTDIDPLTGCRKEVTVVNGQKITKTINVNGELVDIDIEYDPFYEGIEIEGFANMTKPYKAHYPLSVTSLKDYEKLMKEEEESKVDIKESNTVEKDPVIYCYDEKDLSVERILTTISAVKGRLQLRTLPIHVKEIICIMTPATRKNIIDASKKLKMYGKKLPIIARFDEYGNKLPDTIDIGLDHGITLQIIDPEDVGGKNLYFELKAITFITKNTIEDLIDELPDLPF